jgi:hypothetical protein
MPFLVHIEPNVDVETSMWKFNVEVLKPCWNGGRSVAFNIERLFIISCYCSSKCVNRGILFEKLANGFTEDVFVFFKS